MDNNSNKNNSTADIKQGKKSATRASSFRSLLALLLAATIIGGGALYYFKIEHLKEYSLEVGHRVADSTASVENINELQNLKDQITSNGTMIDSANSIFATQENYQQQAVVDARKYATLAGVNLLSTTFNDSSSGAKLFTVTLSSPTNYNGLIKFLRGIEKNMPKMETQSIELSRSDSGNGSITVANLTLVIHTR